MKYPKGRKARKLLPSTRLSQLTARQNASRRWMLLKKTKADSGLELPTVRQPSA